MAHAWNACWVHALGGSNPPSSACVMCRDIVHTMSRHFLCSGVVMCRVIVPLFWWMCQVIVPFFGCSQDGRQRVYSLAVPGVPGAILLSLRLLFTVISTVRGRLDS